MPSPMMFICPLRSFTRRTGPRFTPRRTGTVPHMSRIAMAAHSASSGSPMKVTAAPSPVSRMMRSRAATCSRDSPRMRLKACLSCSCSATGFLEYSAMSRNRTLQTSVRLVLSTTLSTGKGGSLAATGLFYAHARPRSHVRGNEKNARFFPRGSQNHPLRHPELHLPGGEVRHHHGQPSLQLFRGIRGLDAGENGARAVARVQAELEQLVGALHMLGLHDLRDAQVKLGEVFDGDLIGHGLLLRGVLLLLGVALRRGRLRHRLNIEQLLELLLGYAPEQVLVFADAMVLRRPRVDVGPLEIRQIEEALRIGRELGKDRLEIDGQDAEQVERDRADGVELLFRSRLLRQLPGLLLVDELIGDIGQRHDFAQRLAELALLVEGGNLRRLGREIERIG